MFHFYAIDIDLITLIANIFFQIHVFFLGFFKPEPTDDY